MSDKDKVNDKKKVDVEHLDVNELDEESLEDVAGGVTINFGCPR